NSASAQRASRCVSRANGWPIGAASGARSSASWPDCGRREPIDGQAEARLLEVDAEDRHVEIIRALAVLVVDEQDADVFVADVDFGGIVLLRARHDANARVAEQALEIGVELADFLNVHGPLPGGSAAALTAAKSASTQPTLRALHDTARRFVQNAQALTAPRR